MAEVYVDNEDNIEKSIKKFKKIIDREGILLEVKKRRYFTKPASLRHEKSLNGKEEKKY